MTGQAIRDILGTRFTEADVVLQPTHDVRCQGSNPYTTPLDVNEHWTRQCVPLRDRGALMCPAIDGAGVVQGTRHGCHGAPGAQSAAKVSICLMTSSTAARSSSGG